jgi:hypothetical protein
MHSKMFFFQNFRHLKKIRWWGIYSHEPKWVSDFKVEKTLQRERYEPTGVRQQFFTVFRGVTNDENSDVYDLMPQHT